MPSELFVVGLSWRTAPVAVREKLAFPDDEVPTALTELLRSTTIAEAVVLSTCNRVEIYGATAQTTPASAVASAAAEARSVLAASRGIEAEELAASLYEYIEDDASKHAFRVAAALDSLVVGEAQILGQLKAAYGVSVKTGAAGPILGRCLERAFGVAKRVRSETGIARGAANVSSVAVELAQRVFIDLAGKTVLVVGAGKMSALAARHLRADGAGQIVVTNRSPEKAEALADEIDGVARPWDQLESLLGMADVVISSTGSREPVLTKKLFKRVSKKRRYEPILVIDIAVPRDAEASIGRLDGVYLFDIDDLERVVASNLKERAKEAEAAEKIVDHEVEQFRSWLRSQRVVPTIRSMRERFVDIARAEVDKAVEQIVREQDPVKRERQVRRLGDLIVNKLLHTPTTALRHSGERDVEGLVMAAQRLFQLEEDQQPQEAAPAGAIAEAAEAAGKNRGSG
jgi:glutamyl-tRNA reductase